MTQATIVGIQADHGNQITHVDVETWEPLPGGIRRRLDALSLSFPGATLDVDVITQQVRQQLVAAGILTASDPISMKGSG